MQHDLALAMGCSVAHLRATMSHSEYVNWISYTEKFGPLNPSLRVEAAMARVAALLAKDGKVADFMPYPRKPDEEMTPADLARAFGAKVKAPRANG